MPLTPEQERDYQRLKGLENLLVNKDPKIKDKFGRILKEADPTATVPWIEQSDVIEARVAERIKPHEDEIKELRMRLNNREAEEANERAINKLKRAPFNLTTEQIDEVKALVAAKYKEGEILSYDTAARYWISSHSPVAASSPVRTPFSTRLNRPKSDFRKMLRDPKSRIFTDPQGLIQEDYDRAWEEGIEMIGQQQG